jgi:hypothetical protein
MTEHHATVCIADSLEDSVVPEVYKKQSGDTSHIICDRFSISDARKLSRDALQKPLSQDYRVFVLVVKKLPEESQNALLKLFEEPPQQTKFFLVIPQDGILLPTLRSRVVILFQNNVVEQTNEIFSTFASDSFAGRMTTISTLTKKKDIATIDLLLLGAESYAAQMPVQRQDLLQNIIFIRKYAKTPGASIKMLLEEMALVLPRI